MKRDFAPKSPKFQDSCAVCGDGTFGSRQASVFFFFLHFTRVQRAERSLSVKRRRRRTGRERWRQAGLGAAAVSPSPRPSQSLQAQQRPETRRCFWRSLSAPPPGSRVTSKPHRGVRVGPVTHWLRSPPAASVFVPSALPAGPAELSRGTLLEGF